MFSAGKGDFAEGGLTGLAKELGDKLARARDLARASSDRERELASKSGSRPVDQSLGDQQAVIEATRTLADLLKRLRSVASEEDRALGQTIARAVEANDPGPIEQDLRRSLDAMASGDRTRAGGEMLDASRRLDALARDLETARREFVQPRLQQLLALEKQAAEARKALESASSESGKAEADKAVADLARALNAAKPRDGAIKEAAEALEQAAQGGASTGWRPPEKAGTRAGLFTPPVGSSKAVQQASKALQARIQELILVDALVDRDGPVPPGYKEKVENYFRVLSEDLR